MSYSIITLNGIKLVSSNGSTYAPNLPGSGGDLIQDNFYYLSQITPGLTTGRLLQDVGSQTSIDWGNRQGIDSNNFTTLDWGNKYLGDAGFTSIDWDSRILYGYDSISEGVYSMLEWNYPAPKMVIYQSDPTNAQPGMFYYNNKWGKYRGYLSAASGWVNLN